jgi:hypothetical protein
VVREQQPVSTLSSKKEVEGTGSAASNEKQNYQETRCLLSSNGNHSTTVQGWLMNDYHYTDGLLLLARLVVVSCTLQSCEVQKTLMRLKMVRKTMNETSAPHF